MVSRVQRGPGHRIQSRTSLLWGSLPHFLLERSRGWGEGNGSIKVEAASPQDVANPALGGGTARGAGLPWEGVPVAQSSVRLAASVVSDSCDYGL